MKNWLYKMHVENAALYPNNISPSDILASIRQRGGRFYQRGDRLANGQIALVENGNEAFILKFIQQSVRDARKRLRRNQAPPHDPPAAGPIQDPPDPQAFRVEFDPPAALVLAELPDLERNGAIEYQPLLPAAPPFVDPDDASIARSLLDFLDSEMELGEDDEDNDDLMV